MAPSKASPHCQPHRGGSTERSRGGSTERSRGGSTERSRGGSTERSRGVDGDLHQNPANGVV
ncbi:hypothetical protein E1H13_16160 [Nodosilinea sp. P-1105]|nr:hypothetical protein [Nodosilinea sp. P-1105]